MNQPKMRHLSGSVSDDALHEQISQHSPDSNLQCLDQGCPILFEKTGAGPGPGFFHYSPAPDSTN